MLPVHRGQTGFEKNNGRTIRNRFAARPGREFGGKPWRKRGESSACTG